MELAEQRIVATDSTWLPTNSASRKLHESPSIQQQVSISVPIRTQRSNIKEVVKTGVGENNVHFHHLLGMLKLAWYLKSRFVGTHRCCQQRHTAALHAALFGAT